MIKAWHFIFYSIYKLLCKVSLIITYPIRLIYRIPRLKKYYKKKGYDPEKSFDHYDNNLEYGLNIEYSEYIMLVFLIAILFSFFNLALIIINIHISWGIHIPLIILLIAFILNYTVLLKDNYYISFNEFDTYYKVRKRGYYILSYLFVIIVFVAFYYSFIYGSEYHSIKNKYN